MKIGIVGSRNFNNYELLADYLDNYFLNYLKNEENNSAIISGGAKGADSLGEEYAKNNGIECIIFNPDWNKHGKTAGFIRNQHIVDASDMIIAFWDGKSKGTKDTLDKAQKAKKPTFIVYFQEV